LGPRRVLGGTDDLVAFIDGLSDAVTVQYDDQAVLPQDWPHRAGGGAAVSDDLSPIVDVRRPAVNRPRLERAEIDPRFVGETMMAFLADL
jgi:hypothetical protein